MRVMIERVMFVAVASGMAIVAIIELFNGHVPQAAFAAVLAVWAGAMFKAVSP